MIRDTKSEALAMLRLKGKPTDPASWAAVRDILVGAKLTDEAREVEAMIKSMERKETKLDINTLRERLKTSKALGGRRLALGERRVNLAQQEAENIEATRQLQLGLEQGRLGLARRGQQLEQQAGETSSRLGKWSLPISTVGAGIDILSGINQAKQYRELAGLFKQDTAASIDLKKRILNQIGGYR